MLPNRAESDRQIRDASPMILMAIFVASVVSAASSTAILGVELYREWRVAQMFDRLQNPPARPPVPPILMDLHGPSSRRNQPEWTPFPEVPK